MQNQKQTICHYGINRKKTLMDEMNSLRQKTVARKEKLQEAMNIPRGETAASGYVIRCLS